MSLYFNGTQIGNVGVTFEGTSGTDTSDATLTSGDQMLEGTSAYSKGKKYSGTIPTKEVATPSISVSFTGQITATNTQAAGYTAGATKTATKQLSVQAAKTVTPTTSEQTAVVSGVYTTGAVKVGAISTETKSITSNGTYTPTDGKYFSSVTVNVPSSGGATPSLQSKTVTPTTSKQTITADNGYDGLSSVTVNAISTQTKSATPTTSQQTISADNGKYLASVTVGAIQTETKSITDNGTYTPTSGKYFSSVTVNVPYQTYRTGSGAPSNSLGSDGDLYFDMG